MFLFEVQKRPAKNFRERVEERLKESEEHHTNTGGAKQRATLTDFGFIKKFNCVY